MSNQSRGRAGKLYNPPAPEVEPDPEEVERAERLADALDTPGKAGLRKLVGMVLDARNKPEPDEADAAEGSELITSTARHTPLTAPNADPEPVREPTAYEAAILYGLRDKPVYQGTVETWRVEQRRARNKQARRSRQRSRRRARGRAVGAA